MKRTERFLILLLLFCGLFCNSCFSQKQRDSLKLEAGLGVPSFPTTLNINISSNLSFKYRFHKNAIRTGLTTFWYHSGDHKAWSTLGNAGFEHRFFGRKIQLITGIDLCYLHTYSEPQNHPDSISNYTATFYHWGAGPVIGGIWNFHPRFSFQTEYGFYYGYGERKITRDGVTTVPVWGKGSYYTFQRYFSLHLYYRFGK